VDIKRKVQSPGSQGNAASEYSDILQRACDWQYGRAATANDIEDEGQEEDLAFGVPHSTMDFDPKKGILATASDAASSIASKVAAKVQQVKDTYKAGAQQTNQLPAELKATRDLYAEGQKALDQDKPQQDQGKQ
jgi:hypothetical protein